ncbi:Oidioi.mRNA.OKI2018_I69.XSR.g14377.t1.cds [Oikopleura dioica]|uniref:Oidioi.mRNA.OKI2018_I69.XSR.g14377.t1.cds n=1 Tax=Oikopleura dioica TaxID=34765 RepID=A0ABN7S9L8_OIKDI|nr:Oidioi.mRNA.OKI2018_I69.XSR.g14377.t1.cds [Oikopleura dioica]
MCCLQSYKRGRRKLPFNLFRSSSKLDFEIVVVDVLPDANPGSKPKVEVEVVNTGAHPIYVQLALHEQQLLFETNLLANDGKVDDTSFPTVYKKVESGESKRLFKGFNDESQDFYEKFFENSPNIPSQLFGSLNIIPQWCKASENLSSFFNSENYFTYSNQDCDSTLAEFFMLNLEWHREYFESLQKLPSRRKPKGRRQS